MFWENKKKLKIKYQLDQFNVGDKIGFYSIVDSALGTIIEKTTNSIIVNFLIFPEFTEYGDLIWKPYNHSTLEHNFLKYVHVLTDEQYRTEFEQIKSWHFEQIKKIKQSVELYENLMNDFKIS